MELHHLSYPALGEPHTQPIVLAIGYFDGVHRGHQAVIHTAKQMAERLGCQLAVMTFSPHPKEVLQPGTMQRYLTPLTAKLHHFRELGVAKTFVVRFDQTLAQLSPADFVHEILLHLAVKGVVTGDNFHFGQRQMGDVHMLRQLGIGKFRTEVVPAVIDRGQPISSTRIRHLLATGELDMVAQLLGRPFRLQGTVVKGDQRGRLIGFPTANIEVSEPFCLPQRGVYVVRGRWQHGSLAETAAYGMMNIGLRPTFKTGDKAEKVEVHLFAQAVDLDLYGRELSVDVLRYLRPEQKFASVDALVRQLQQDQQAADVWLSAQGNGI